MGRHNQWTTALLDAAEEAGFEILVTADRNIRAQQRLTGRRIALIVLSTNHWVTIRDNAELLAGQGRLPMFRSHSLDHRCAAGLLLGGAAQFRPLHHLPD
jgi:hypothetical protein